MDFLLSFSGQSSVFVVAATGLTPSEYSSGGHVSLGQISRQGGPRFRHMLGEAAWKVVRKDPVTQEYYQKLSAWVGKPKAALIPMRCVWHDDQLVSERLRITQLNQCRVTTYPAPKGRVYREVRGVPRSKAGRC
jgi:hypothetical protein